jgi:septum formation protein
LLKRFGVPFRQEVPEYDEEQIVSSDGPGFVTLATRGKMAAAIRAFGLKWPLLCADTVIVAEDGAILRKPKNLSDARQILTKQSGSTISIFSSLHYRRGGRLFTDLSATHYRFAAFDPEGLTRYLESGEWQGKAGGCMVEGFCKRYIISSEGLESTARGLQVERLLPWL